MILKQYYLGCLAHASYLLGDDASSTRHIEGSVNIPLNHLKEHWAEIPSERRIAVHCADGYRSSIAAGILHRHGMTRFMEMAGGLAAWDAAQLRVVSQN
jgi:rhodanese-related sulfurtransferase